MKKLSIIVIGLVCTYIPFSQKVKDLLLWPVASRLLGLSYTKIVRLKNGLLIKASMDDILNRFIVFVGPFISYIWEPSTMKLLELLAKNKESIVVAGSHIGFTVLEAAKETAGHVYAFEPVTYLFDRSKENIALNPQVSKKITLEKKALGKTQGTATMYIENIRSSIIPYSKNHVDSRTEQVPLTTLDAYASQKGIQGFDLVFLDIEGYELFALLGGENVLQQHPDLILEVSPRVMSKNNNSSEELFTFLQSKGYEIYIIIDNYKAVLTRKIPVIELVPLTSVEANQYKNYDYFNIFATVSSQDEVMQLAHIKL